MAQREMPKGHAANDELYFKEEIEQAIADLKRTINDELKNNQFNYRKGLSKMGSSYSWNDFKKNCLDMVDETIKSITIIYSDDQKTLISALKNLSNKGGTIITNIIKVIGESETAGTAKKGLIDLFVPLELLCGNPRTSNSVEGLCRKLNIPVYGDIYTQEGRTSRTQLLAEIYVTNQENTV